MLSLFTKKTPRPEINHFKIIQATSGKFHLHEMPVLTQYASLAKLIEAHCNASNCLPTRLKCTPKGDIPASATGGGGRERERREDVNQREKKIEKIVPTTKDPPKRACSSNKCPWCVDESELEIMEEIGSGSFGVVHQAKFRKIIVAVKTMIKGAISEDDFIREAKVMT